MRCLTLITFKMVYCTGLAFALMSLIVRLCNWYVSSGR